MTVGEDGCWMLDAGCWILDAGYWMLDTGCWMLGKTLVGVIRKTLLAAVFLACLFLTPENSKAQDSVVQKEPGYFVADGGIYSCLDLWAITGYINFQVQPGVKLWILRPQAGVMLSFSGALMVYGGLTWPATPVKWLVLETGAAAGYYESGDGITLAFPLEFRLSFAVMYRFQNYIQLGATFAHISNANLSPPNPGTESISVILKVPLRKMKAY